MSVTYCLFAFLVHNALHFEKSLFPNLLLPNETDVAVKFVLNVELPF